MALNLKVSEINFLFSLNKLEFSFDFAIFFLLEELNFLTKIQNLNLKLKKKRNQILHASITLNLFQKSTHINELI